jgi:hypothetical protein
MNGSGQHAPALLYLLNLTAMDGGNVIVMLSCQGHHWSSVLCAAHAGAGWRLDTCGYPISRFHGYVETILLRAKRSTAKIADTPQRPVTKIAIRGKLAMNVEILYLPHGESSDLGFCQNCRISPL